MVHMSKKYIISSPCGITPYAQLPLTAENEPSKVKSLIGIVFLLDKKMSKRVFFWFWDPLDKIKKHTAKRVFFSKRVFFWLSEVFQRPISEEDREKVQ